MTNATFDLPHTLFCLAFRFRIGMLGALIALLLPGCMTPADRAASDGVAAFDRCDVRSARDHFADAHRADQGHPQAALGFALTDLALLPESPEATAILESVGFTAPVDMQQIVYGSDGALARMARHDSCSSITDYLDGAIPYPPLRDSNLRARSLLRSGLTGEDLRPHLAGLLPHLAGDAAALETAAAGLDGPAYRFSGGCGGSSHVALQRPELYAAAALLELAHALLEVGLSYDWGFVLALLDPADDGERRALVAELNAHLGHLTDPSGFARGRAALEHAHALAASAVQAAKDVRAPVEGQLFDWSKLPTDRLDELARLIASVRSSIDRATALADVTPALTLDLGRVLASPPNAAALSGPLFLTRTDAMGRISIAVDQARVDEALAGSTAPSLFGQSVPSFRWTPVDAWRTVMADPILAPVRSLETTYSCR